MSGMKKFTHSGNTSDHSQEERSKIRAHICPDCYLCGRHGKILYAGLEDRFFGAPGKWNFKECSNPECGLIWLDPMPLEEDIGKAYQAYYTHKPCSHKKKKLNSKIILMKILRSTFKGLMYVSLIRQERNRLNLMYLDKTKPGRMLEIGCGDGSRLNKIRSFGWKVEGQEVDPEAANNARNTYRLSVCLGPLNDLCLVESSYDAIIMNHVIEHLHDPVAVLRECHRLLAPNGILVVVTPNINSFGHRYFGHDCRSLDPPRHLHLFSPKNLNQVALKAGFQNYKIWTTAAKAQRIAEGSYQIQKNYFKKGALAWLSIDIAAMLFQLWATAVHTFRPDSGEECILKAVR